MLDVQFQHLASCILQLHMPMVTKCVLIAFMPLPGPVWLRCWPRWDSCGNEYIPVEHEHETVAAHDLSTGLTNSHTGLVMELMKSQLQTLAGSSEGLVLAVRLRLCVSDEACELQHRDVIG